MKSDWQDYVSQFCSTANVVTIERPAAVRLGIHSPDMDTINDQFGEKIAAEILGDCPPRRARIRPFRVMRCAITKESFRRIYLESSLSISDEDKQYWYSTFDVSGYSDDMPVLGVSYAEAITFCSLVGGRLLREEEFEFLLRGRQRSGFLGYQASRSLTQGTVKDILMDVIPVDSPDLACSSQAVKGLWGNVRELVQGAYGPDYWLRGPVIKPLGRRDKIFYSGLRIEMNEDYLSGAMVGMRCYNLEPAGFRVAFDL